MPDLTDNIKKAAEIISNANGIFITAGAGMGVDSGLPDFRGDTGFWKAYPPMGKLGISFVEMANPQWFQINPRLAWGFYGHRLSLYRKTTPHVGFNYLLDIAKQKPKGYFVFTSNVDGQFQKAGFDENRIEECHGSIHHLQCVIPCTDEIWSAKDLVFNVNEETFLADEPLPRCKDCKALSRPNVLMFGDWTWIPHRTNIQSYRCKQWLNELVRSIGELVIIECGAGMAVPTVRYMSESIAQSKNAKLIRINPRDYNVPYGHISIPLSAKEGIERINGCY